MLCCCFDYGMVPPDTTTNVEEDLSTMRITLLNSEERFVNSALYLAPRDSHKGLWIHAVSSLCQV